MDKKIAKAFDKAQTKDRIEKLREEIDNLRYRYHVLDDPTVTDAIYDSLTRELKSLEEEWPEFQSPYSPTQRVGGKPLDKFEKVTHRVPMLSLSDAFDEREFKAWDERNRKLLPVGTKLEYFTELKVDGFAVSLIYEKGVFKVGATRGDGRVGEDVTQNLKTIRAIPLRLRSTEKKIEKILGRNISRTVLLGRIEVRGEVYMTKKAFEGVNREQKKKGGPVYANPRNLAAGTIRQLNPSTVASRDLSFMAYDLITSFGQERHSAEHAILKELGFKTVEPDAICKNSDEVVEFREKVAKMRGKLKFDIDGIVVSLDQNEIFERLGVVGKAPRGSIAFKFPGKEATTVIEDIIVQVGRTGVLTPVAVLKPVEVSGVTVRRATLHNLDEIRRLDVRVGDTVIIERAGDVIPALTGAIKRLRPKNTHEFNMPHKCPICGSEVTRRKGEVAYRCSNKNCAAIQRKNLYHFVSKRALDIRWLGVKNIDTLVENGLVRDAADLFFLKKEDVEGLERFAEKSASNMVEAIAAKKLVPLNRFIYSFGIPHVGEETAMDLAQNFGSVEKLKKASTEELQNVRDIGGVVAQSIYSWFRTEKNLRLLEKLKKAGVKTQNPKPRPQNQKLIGKTFVLTGGLESMTRDEVKEKIRSLGGNISEGVSKNTNYVVVGSEAGSKLEKAKKLGVKIVNEKEFLKFIE